MTICHSAVSLEYNEKQRVFPALGMNFHPPLVVSQSIDGWSSGFNFATLFFPSTEANRWRQRLLEFCNNENEQTKKTHKSILADFQARLRRKIASITMPMAFLHADSYCYYNWKLYLHLKLLIFWLVQTAIRPNEQKHRASTKARKILQLLAGYSVKNIPVSASNALLVLFLLFLRSSILYIWFSPAAHLSSLGRLSAKTWSIEHQFEIDIVELQLSPLAFESEYIYAPRALCKIVSLFESENAPRRDKGADALIFSCRVRSEFWPVT